MSYSLISKLTVTFRRDQWVKEIDTNNDNQYTHIADECVTN